MYELKCADGNAVYVGQTECNFDTKIKEYKQ